MAALDLLVVITVLPSIHRELTLVRISSSGP